MTRAFRMTGTALAFCVTGAGFAMGQDSGLDADGDGLVTYDELAAAMPDMTEDMFATLDLDGSGALEPQEIAAAEEAGYLTTG